MFINKAKSDHDAIAFEALRKSRITRDTLAKYKENKYDSQTTHNTNTNAHTQYKKGNFITNQQSQRDQRNPTSTTHENGDAFALADTDSASAAQCIIRHINTHVLLADYEHKYESSPTSPNFAVKSWKQDNNVTTTIINPRYMDDNFSPDQVPMQALNNASSYVDACAQIQHTHAGNPDLTVMKLRWAVGTLLYIRKLIFAFKVGTLYIDPHKDTNIEVYDTESTIGKSDNLALAIGTDPYVTLVILGDSHKPAIKHIALDLTRLNLLVSKAKHKNSNRIQTITGEFIWAHSNGDNASAILDSNGRHTGINGMSLSTITHLEKEMSILTHHMLIENTYN